MEITDQSPYSIGIAGKTGSDEIELENRIDALPEKVRALLFDTGIGTTVRSAVDSRVPEQLLPAIMKMAFFLIMGDANYTDVPALLERSGFTQPQSAAAFAALRQLSDAILAANLKPSALPKPLPPLTVRRPAVGPPPRPPAIIDLRKTQP